MHVIYLTKFINKVVQILTFKTTVHRVYRVRMRFLLNIISHI